MLNTSYKKIIMNPKAKIISILIFLVFIATFVYVKYFLFKPIVKNPTDIQANKVKTTNKKTLVYSYGGNDLAVNKVVNLFQKAHPDIEVKLQQLPNSTDYQRNAYRIALASGDDSVDVFNADSIWTAEFASSGWVQPLEKYFTPAERANVLANAIESCLYKGEIYALPRKADASVLYYRTDIIQTPPTTYKQLVAQAARNLGVKGIKYGYICQAKTYEGLVCNALEFIWNNGGEVMKNNEVVINSPQAIEGLQLFIDLIHSSVSSLDVLNFEEDDSRMAFQDGSAIFMRNWPYAYKHLNMENSKVSGKVGIAPLPIGPKGSISRATLGGWNNMINKNSKNPELAFQLAEWLTSYDMEVLFNIQGDLPARKDVYNHPDVQKAYPWINSFKSIYETARLRPVSPNYSTNAKSMQENLARAIRGNLDAKTAIENIERDLKRNQ